jgi:hypothetical protein
MGRGSCDDIYVWLVVCITETFHGARERSDSLPQPQFQLETTAASPVPKRPLRPEDPRLCGLCQRRQAPAALRTSDDGDGWAESVVIL